jgi:hypothetical protein
MNESTWLTSGAPELLIRHIAEIGSGRQHRLFAVACCRRIWSHIPDQRSKDAVEVAERFADGQATRKELAHARSEAEQAERQWMRQVNDDDSDLRCFGTNSCLLSAGTEVKWCLRAWYDAAETKLSTGARWHDEQALACDLLREIYGNPFSPVQLDDAWLTSEVVGLALAAYDDRAFDRLPILADALEESGCRHPDVLSHCRSGEPHARGCWVVDMILGKK